MMSLSFMMRSSAPSILTSVPDHLPNRTRSPFFRSSGDNLAVLAARAGAHGNDLALLRLLGGGVGDDDAAGRLALAVEPLDEPRGSWRGRNFMSCCSSVIGCSLLRRQMRTATGFAPSMPAMIWPSLASALRRFARTVDAKHSVCDGKGDSAIQRTVTVEMPQANRHRL